MEPLSMLAGAISQYVLPKALEKLGEKIGESALKSSSESIQALRETVCEKMTTTHMEGVLTQAQKEPSEANVKLLESVLLNQIATDPVFAAQLKTLLTNVYQHSPELQSVLENVRIKGNAEVGNVVQLSNGSDQQVVGRNVGVGGNLKIGDITQKS
jgi:hypothetical protein